MCFMGVRWLFCMQRLYSLKRRILISIGLKNKSLLTLSVGKINQTIFQYQMYAKAVYTYCHLGQHFYPNGYLYINQSVQIKS